MSRGQIKMSGRTLTKFDSPGIACHPTEFSTLRTMYPSVRIYKPDSLFTVFKYLQKSDLSRWKISHFFQELLSILILTQAIKSVSGRTDINRITAQFGHRNHMGMDGVAPDYDNRNIGKPVRIIRVHLHAGLHSDKHRTGFYFQRTTYHVMPQSSGFAFFMPINIHLHTIIAV